MCVCVRVCICVRVCVCVCVWVRVCVCPWLRPFTSQSCFSLTDYFYPFGADAGDRVLRVSNSNDRHSHRVSLSHPFPIFGENVSDLYVSGLVVESSCAVTIRSGLQLQFIT